MARTRNLGEGFGWVLVQVAKNCGSDVNPEDPEQRILALMSAGALDALGANVSQDKFLALAMEAYEVAQYRKEPQVAPSETDSHPF